MSSAAYRGVSEGGGVGQAPGTGGGVACVFRRWGRSCRGRSAEVAVVVAVDARAVLRPRAGSVHSPRVIDTVTVPVPQRQILCGAFFFWRRRSPRGGRTAELHPCSRPAWAVTVLAHRIDRCTGRRDSRRRARKRSRDGAALGRPHHQSLASPCRDRRRAGWLRGSVTRK